MAKSVADGLDLGFKRIGNSPYYGRLASTQIRNTIEIYIFLFCAL